MIVSATSFPFYILYVGLCHFLSLLIITSSHNCVIIFNINLFFSFQKNSLRTCYPFLFLILIHLSLLTPLMSACSIFPAGGNKRSAVFMTAPFFITLFEKADSSVEKQGGDTLGSVNSCVMSESVKHTGGGLSRDFCKKCFVFE